MSRYIESSNWETLKTLHSYIVSGDLALPDFQRNLVWSAKDAHALLVSLANDNPAGSLLALRNGSTSFKPRGIAEAPSIRQNPPYLLLDGQQRLTVLYQALSGRGETLFFVNLAQLEVDEDFEDALFFLSATAKRGLAKNRREKYETLEGQVADLVLPLAVLFNDAGLDKWIRDVRRATGDDELEDRLDTLKKRWFDPILAYRFPWVVLRADTPAPAVCNMFEELNKRGIRLSVFDLLVARFWSSDVMLRNMWEQTQASTSEITRFGIDPYYLLQMIALVSTYEVSKAKGVTPTSECKKGTVLDLKAADVQSWWQFVDSALEETLKRLSEDCGVWAPKWVPYDTMIVPFAAVLAYRKRTTGEFPGGAERRRLNRWFWCTVFGQAYEQGATSQAAKDFVELLRWLSGGAEPASVAAFSFDPDDLDSVGPRQSALYKGVIALMLAGKPEPRDFRTFGSVGRSVWESEADDHHIFPYAYLRDTLHVADEKRRNVVLNRTLIDRDTNKRISKKPPATYFAELRAEQSADDGQMEEFFSSHLIPPAPTWSNDYARFLAERKVLVADRIKSVTS